MKNHVWTVHLSELTYDIIYKIHNDIVNWNKEGSYDYYYDKIYDHKKEELIVRLGDPKIDTKIIEEQTFNKENLYNKESENILVTKDWLLYSYPKEIDIFTKVDIMNKLFELDLEIFEYNIKDLDIKIQSKEMKIETMTTEYDEDRIYWPIEYKLQYVNNSKDLILNSLIEEFNIQKGYYALETKFLNLIKDKYNSFGNDKLEYFTIWELDWVSEKAMLAWLIYLYYKWYIDIKGFSYEDTWYELNIKIFIDKKILTSSDKITEEMIKLIEEEWINKITLFKNKQWHFSNMEREHHIEANESRYVDLVNKFPHSEIESKVYKWKTTKHIVKEKIKLEKEE